jgi:hypothetical protein
MSGSHVPDHAIAEGVRTAIGLYCQALDDGRVDDVLATFWSDGVLEFVGNTTYRGHDELRAFYETTARSAMPRRHQLANTHIVGWDNPLVTAHSDFSMVELTDTGWRISVVGRYRDTLRHQDGVVRFSHRVLDLTN